MNKRPPFQITDAILRYVTDISEMLGELSSVKYVEPELSLRKSSQAVTIQGSLAIEGNTLTLDQVNMLLSGKPVIGPERDILEVKNAAVVYDQLHAWKYHSILSFKQAHANLMKGLVKDSGRWREKNVAVYSGKDVKHMAPPTSRVPVLMKNLFAFLKSDKATLDLIKACVFHYELEFIHPFSDGNGRMGRLWQQVILVNYHPVFAYLPIENLMHQYQDAYYDVLATCDHAGESTAFVELMLEWIAEALHSYCKTIMFQPNTAELRLTFAKEAFEQQLFSRKEYLQLMKTISAPTASRDLASAVKHGILHKQGDKALTRYRFK